MLNVKNEWVLEADRLAALDKWDVAPEDFTSGVAANADVANDNFVDLEFSDAQYNLITAEEQFPAFCGGFGSGKSEALVTRALLKKCIYPKNDVAYYMPTFDLVRTLGYPRFEEKLDKYKISYRLNKTFARIEAKNAGSIIFRTMEKPERIIAYEVADSFVDEIDTLKMEIAKAVWIKIMARNRQKKFDGSLNTIAVGSTPEGFRFLYENWKNNPPSLMYRLIHASTWSNERNLPAGYIESLLAQYPPQLIAAYLDGEFVNLTGGSVYPEFDRLLNRSFETITANDNLLHIGMDFNVTNMTAIVNVFRGKLPHAVDELTKIYDTPRMIEAINNRFPHKTIVVYPDASGDARHTNNASDSDLDLLKAAGFHVIANPSNPAIKDRVVALNAIILNAEGQRRLKINIEKCPVLVSGLEKQIWDTKKGEPDKTSGWDHANDAEGYFINHTFPIKRQSVQRARIAGA